MTPPFVSEVWPLALTTLPPTETLIQLVDQDLAGLPCQSGDPERFFAENPQVIEAAKLECAVCPVRVECLAGALRRREPHGVWGGQWIVDGQVVARKRPRGRPKKIQQVAA